MVSVAWWIMLSFVMLRGIYEYFAPRSVDTLTTDFHVSQ